jgi:hypothetical protein
MVHAGWKHQSLRDKVMNTPNLFTPVLLGALEAMTGLVVAGKRKGRNS